MAGAKPCRYWNTRAGCHYGQHCRFSHADSHDHASRTQRSQDTRSRTDGSSIRSQPRPLSDSERRLRDWSRNVREETSPLHLGSRLSTFLREAQELVVSDAGTRQAVVKELASCGGLQRVIEILEGDDVALSTESRMNVFCHQHYLLMRIMVNEHVLDSPTLEAAVNALFTCVYGIGGRRFFKVAGTIRSALSVLIQDSSLASPNPINDMMETIMHFIAIIIEVNGNAKVQPESQPIADGLLADFEQLRTHLDDRAAQKCIQYLNRAHRRLETGHEIPLLRSPLTASTERSDKKQTLFTRDGPGELSKAGPRHDNDHAKIEDISVLPTMAEVKAERSEYLPTRYPSEWHVGGTQGLLDRHFRLLREDTIGQLRDVIGVNHQSYSGPALSLHRQHQGLRSYTYRPIHVESLAFDDRSGLSIEVRFPQPRDLANAGRSVGSSDLRREWWQRSKRLRPDALVAFISHDEVILYCTVAPESNPRPEENASPSVDQKTLFSDAQYAFTRLKLVQTDARSYDSFLHRATQRTEWRLMEFPGVLLPAFEPTLEALKRMSKNEELPFSEFLAPCADQAAGLLDVPPPTYAGATGFHFDLRAVTRDRRSLMLRPNESFDVNQLEEASSLDRTQCASVVDALTRRLALIQGPPGTGKSYTGVAIIKILLDNKRPSRLGPLICVCYTNHALDQLLEHLVNAGIDNVVRIGSQSKSDLIKPRNLNELVRGVQGTRSERTAAYDCHQNMKGLTSDICNRIDLLQQGSDNRLIRTWLEQMHKDHYQTLFGNQLDEDGFQVQKDRRHQPLKSWLAGGTTHPARSVDIVSNLPLFELARDERQLLYQSWRRKSRHDVSRELRHLICEWHTWRKCMDDLRLEKQMRCLEDASVVGVTTSGLARNLELLRRSKAKVMVCEEAGEVLEAHALTALLPTIEHAIMIGDHQQLRPQIAKYEFGRESTHNNPYALDTSLFERLVDPADAAAVRLPYSTLETQRRMHPDISELIRHTLYPSLKDAEGVSLYPPISGMRRRLFWLDHRNLEWRAEGNDSAEPVGTSHSNDFEVEMTAALVSHLLKQGVYQPQDIAVLTPYLGQLQKLRRRLGQMWEIVLDDRDLEQLEAKGAHESEPLGAAATAQEHGQPSPSKSGASRTSALAALKVATVDNFQGEEAKVVLVSLVRSNPENKCGFLKTSNRINVLLSRAQHGMYLIGNAQTYGNASVKMWRDVLDMLQVRGQLGTHLELQCPRHADTPLLVSSPDDFARQAPEGGCGLPCRDRLACGHACVSLCHSEMLHQSVVCLEPCPRSLPGCDHSCPAPCGHRCPECLITVRDPDRTLTCGHKKMELPCWQTRALETVQCHARVERTMPLCGHKITVPCHRAESGLQCTAKCGELLECGHTCAGKCVDCTRPVHESTVVRHVPCEQLCQRAFSTCAHSCREKCHSGSPCSPCTATCESSCAHSRCRKKCNEPCAPCAEPSCSSGCDHGACTLPCAAPCDWIPCSKRCARLLTCGHRCPSVCGEDCPDARYCHTCCGDSVRSQTVDFIEMRTYGELDPDQSPVMVALCGHVMTAESMDGQMDLQKHYELSEEGQPIQIKPVEHFLEDKRLPRCSQCRGPLTSFKRYARVTQCIALDESTRKFIVWSRKEYATLCEAFHTAEAGIATMSVPRRSVVGSIRTPITITRDMAEQIRRLRHCLAPVGLLGPFNNLLRAFSRIDNLAGRIRKEEQPYRKVWDLCQDAQRRKGTTNSFQFSSEVLQTGEHLRAQLLLMKCHRTVVAELIRILSLHSEMFGDVDLTVSLDQVRQTGEQLTQEACKAQKWGSAVEGHLSVAHYAIIERSASDRGETSEALRTIGANHVEKAKQLCEKHPGSTKGLSEEVEHLQKMLRDSTFYSVVTSTERRAIVRAMINDLGRSTGHWYMCANGHPFAVGECGGPMQESHCPECGAPVGGQNHMAADGVSLAAEMEQLRL